MSRWQDTVGQGFAAARLRGTDRTMQVPREDGTIGGVQVEHWDDSMDAQIYLRPVVYKMFPAEIGPERPDQRLEWVLDELSRAGIVPPKELWT